MFSSLDGPAGETNDYQILSIKVKVYTQQGRYFIFALLTPETFLSMIDSIGTVVKRVCKYLFVDLANELYLRLFLDVEYHFFVLKDSDREIIGADDQLLLAIIIPIHKLNGGCIVSCNCPETFICRNVKASNGTVAC